MYCDGVYFAIVSNMFYGIAAIAGGFVLAGLSIPMFYASNGVAKEIISITKIISRSTKNMFIKKEK